MSTERIASVGGQVAFVTQTMNAAGRRKPKVPGKGREVSAHVAPNTTMPTAPSPPVRATKRAKGRLTSSHAVPTPSRSKSAKTRQAAVVTRASRARPSPPKSSARKAIYRVPPSVPLPTAQTTPSKRRARQTIGDAQTSRASDGAPSQADAGQRASGTYDQIACIPPSSQSATDRAIPPSVPPSIPPTIPPGSASADLIADLRLYSRRRHDAVIADGNLTRQMKRVVSRILGKRKVTTQEVKDHEHTEAIAPLMIAREPLRAWRNREEKVMVQLVEQLPVFDTFWNPISGCGALGLAQIIGEAGDLSNYANPAKVWRRFGLHVAGGRAFATWRSKGGLSAKDWKQVGYSPRRRSLMFTITDSLLKKQNAYKTLCDERKAVERKKAEAEGLTVAAAADIPSGEHEKYRSLGHIKARAERYVAKRLLRDLWRAWRDQGSDDAHATVVPAPAGAL